MKKEEFKQFLEKLQEKNIYNNAFAKWTGYSPESISHFLNGKRPIPLSLQRNCEFVQHLDLIGANIKDKIKV